MLLYKPALFGALFRLWLVLSAGSTPVPTYGTYFGGTGDINVAVAVAVTGEGQTVPAGVTGKVTTVSPTPPLTPQPLLPVAVLINGQPATVAFYGEAPTIVSGVMQLNVQIPPNAPSGDLPVQVSVGGNVSQNGVTISVQ